MPVISITATPHASEDEIVMPASAGMTIAHWRRY